MLERVVARTRTDSSISMVSTENMACDGLWMVVGSRIRWSRVPLRIPLGHARHARLYPFLVHGPHRRQRMSNTSHQIWSSERRDHRLISKAKMDTDTGKRKLGLVATWLKLITSHLENKMEPTNPNANTFEKLHMSK